MPLIPVVTMNEDGLDIYSHKSDVLLMQSGLSEHGLFLGESVRVIERALDAGIEPYSLFVEDRWLDQSRDLIARMEAAAPDLPVFRVNHEQMQAITGYQITRGPLAAFRRPKPRDIHEVLENSRRVAVLEDITNFTNIGSIFRNASAMGIDAILVTPGCHDPYYKRASRVSMGTVFQVPWTRIGTQRDWAEIGIGLLHDYGFKVAALALSDNATSLCDDALVACDKLALMFGTESEGLSATALRCADMTVCIPMDNGVDSLNVASSSAVVFWELCKRPRESS